MITAEIIAIGSELLSPFRVDTNSLYLTRSLEERGIQLVAKSIIGDDLKQLVNAFRVAFERSDVIICSGGIGPTLDDLTKEALASFLNVPLEFHADIFERIEERFRRRGYAMPAINRTQAMIPKGATILQNQHGTAPGVYIETNNKQIFLLPGVPFELRKMWELECLRLLKTEEPFHRKIFHVAMLPESTVDEMLRPVTSALEDVRYTILASPADIEIHLLAPQSASDELISASAEVRAILANRLYAEDEARMEEVVGRLLKEKKRNVAVAESCTGGLLAQRLTSVPGSSAYFERGVVVYSNPSKQDSLGVPAELIAAHGAVSGPIAASMAEKIRALAKTDYGISITGIAGPEGGTPEKPVGTVFVGLADVQNTNVKQYNFPGDRERVRFMSTQAALNLLRLQLLHE